MDYHFDRHMTTLGSLLECLPTPAACQLPCFSGLSIPVLTPTLQAQTDSFNKYLSTCFVPSPVLGLGDLREVRHLSLLPSREDSCEQVQLRLSRIRPGEALSAAEWKGARLL